MPAATRTRRQIQKRNFAEPDSEEDQFEEEAFRPSPRAKRAARTQIIGSERETAVDSSPQEAAKRRKPAPAEVAVAVEPASTDETGHLFYDEEAYTGPLYGFRAAKESKKLKQTQIVDTLKARKASSSTTRALSLAKEKRQAVTATVSSDTDASQLPTPTGSSNPSRNVLLARGVTKDEVTLLGQRCNDLKKKYEEYEEKEKEAKYDYIRSAGFTFLSDEEVALALKDHGDNAGEVVLHFTNHPLYLEEIRERIAKKGMAKKIQELTNEQRALHKRVARGVQGHARRMEKKVVTVARLQLDQAIAMGVTDEWSEARKSAYDKIDKNPNAYYYRFNAPGQQQKTGGWSAAERAMFFERMKEIDIQCARPQWGIFSIPFEGRVGYQCANFYRSMVKNGEVNDPNYYLDAKGTLRYKRGEAKNATDGCPAPSSAAPVSTRRPRAPRAQPRKPVKGKTRRRRGADDDTIFADEVTDLSSDSENGEFDDGGKVEFVSAKAAAAALEEQDSDSDSDEEEANNPLPDYIDPITLDNVEKPAISPFGHVMGYATWVRCLNYTEPKERCPFTKKPLRLRQIIKLTHDNIDEYRNKIVATTTTS